MTYTYYVYFFFQFPFAAKERWVNKQDTRGADFVFTSFGDVISLLCTIPDYKSDIDIDCIENERFLASLRFEQGQWEYLDAECGRTWSAEEYVEEMI